MTPPLSKTSANSWPQFRQIVSGECKLLKELDKFPNSVLVAGCQRSGTTMLSRIITESDGMVNYRFGTDDELDAALILSGYVDHQPHGRYCFQTTYVDQCYHEYFEHKGEFKIIWVLRNPFSVVYSLLYNWAPTALESTVRHCGAHLLTGMDKWLYKLFGVATITRVKRACLLYNAKNSQLFELVPTLGPEKIMVVDYDDLVTRKHVILPQVFRFIDLDYRTDYADKIHSNSLDKALRLSDKETAMVKTLSIPIYLRARQTVIAPELNRNQFQE